MSFTVPIAMFGLPVAAALLFAFLPPRRAVIAAILLCWLFLPMAGYKLEGIPRYTKLTATTGAILLGTVVFHSGRFALLRPTWTDLLAATACLVPFASSLSNGYGMYDGVSSVVLRFLEWGLPYLIGRLYFRELSDLRELAMGLFIGGLIYVPLCLIEIRMSPQLHTWIYGFHQHLFLQSARGGGWRPTVFMQHGLAVGLWMSMATLIGFWLCWSGAWSQKQSSRNRLLFAAVAITTLLCKSTGAIALLISGVLALMVGAWRHSRVPVLFLALGIPAYMTLRATNMWSGDQLLTVASWVSEEREASLQTRLDQEKLLADRAMQRPLTGWGGWGANRITDEVTGEDESITDGYWVIMLGVNGLIGLVGFAGTLLLPVLRLLFLVPASSWRQPAVAPAVALALIVILYMADCLLNAMPNPVYLVVAGALAGTRLDQPHLRTHNAACRVAAPLPSRPRCPEPAGLP